jgi:hypothetical protein
LQRRRETGQHFSDIWRHLFLPREAGFEVPDIVVPLPSMSEDISAFTRDAVKLAQTA